MTDLDNNGKLNFREFLLFMYLLKVLRKGVALPKTLSHDRVRLYRLLSIECDAQMLLPAAYTKLFLPKDVGHSAVACCCPILQHHGS